jgi:hypothetical protein
MNERMERLMNEHREWCERHGYELEWADLLGPVMRHDWKQNPNPTHAELMGLLNA